MNLAIWIRWLFQQMVEVQRDIYLAFAGRIRMFAETGEWSQLAVYLPMGLVFGAVHALTPGHSKLVLATYLAGSPVKAGQALGVSLLLSLIHVSMAVIIALFSLPLVSMALTSVGQAPLLEDVSRGFLGLIGLWMIWQAFRMQGGNSHMPERNAAFGLLAGLIPCPLTLFVMTFAMARQVPQAGLAFAVVMMIGVAFTLSVVAMIAVLFRSALLRVIETRPIGFHFTAALLQGLAGVLILIVAVNALYNSPWPAVL